VAAPYTDTLVVPGARLHYRVRGSGPLLLLLPGGDGDADASDGIAEHLQAAYTVLTYDRRGLSRSAVADRALSPGIATHGDDAHRLLGALTHAPALVFGTSIGAMIALELLSRHPHQVRHLVAYEPPLTELLTDDERAAATGAQAEVEEVFRREGVPEAMMRFGSMVGVDFDDREPDIELPRMTPARLPNLEFFLTHDAPAVRVYRADLPALRAAARRITPGVGRASSSIVGPELSARALGALLDRDVAEFAGGHTAPVLRPAAFAAGLRSIFDPVAAS
jgi:pimeloyl-ACP methyl ester carboxylesterase